MSSFLTVKEADKLVDKSPNSIRRIIYPILEDANHPDRHFILPTPGEAPQLRLRGENFAWRISEELLNREVPPETVSKRRAGNPAVGHHMDEGGGLLEMLRRELDWCGSDFTGVRRHFPFLHPRNSAIPRR